MLTDLPSHPEPEPDETPPTRRVRLTVATISDIDAIESLLVPYFHEFNPSKSLTLNPVKARAWRYDALKRGVPHILLWKDGEPIGLIAWHYDQSFTHEPIADLKEFYVLPEFRKTPAGRVLLAAMIDVARHEGAKLVHAEISSGLPAAKTLANLLRKHGAVETGATLQMEI